MLSGLVLAGGRSSRMGRDKAGLVLPDGATLLQRQVALLRTVGVTRLLVSLRPGSDCQLEGVTPVYDAAADTGPLGGIAAGLQAAPRGLVIVLAVDMPGVTENHLRTLLALASADRGVVPMVAGRCEPLVAVYPSSLAASAEAALWQGQRAVHGWAKQAAEHGHLVLWETPADWSGGFQSWNTPADIPT